MGTFTSLASPVGTLEALQEWVAEMGRLETAFREETCREAIIEAMVRAIADVVAKQPSEYPFRILALGARYHEVGTPERVWVKIGLNDVAMWDPALIADHWVSQQVFCFDDQDPPDLDRLVVLRD